MTVKFRRTIRLVAGWIATHELWFVGCAAPFMLFPMGHLPYLALSLIILTWLCRWLVTSRLSVPTGLDIPIAIIVLMAMVGTIISIQPALSQTRLWSLIIGVILFYGISNSIRTERQALGFSSLLAIMAVGIAGVGLLGADWQQTRLIKASWIYDHLPTLIRGLPNSGVPRVSELIQPRFVGITLGVFVSVFLAHLFFSRYRNLRILSLVVILFGFGTLLLTQTLAGLVGVMAAVLFLAIWRNRWFFLAIPVGFAGVLGSILVAGPTQVFQYFLSVNNPVGIAVALRLDMWSRALAMIRDMPFTGIGLNTFPVIQSSFYPGFLLGPEPHAHNLYIQTALDLGLPGLVAFFWLLAAWLLIVWRKYRSSENREYRILLVGLIAGILAYVVHGFMDAMMIGAKPSVVFWILIGVGVAPIQSINTNKHAVTIRRPHYIGTLLLIILIVGLPLSIVLLSPASVYMNIGAIQAHQALYQSPTIHASNLSTLEKAKATLGKGLALDSGYLNAYELLGRIYANEGNANMALDAFAHRVALDAQAPLLHYFPSEYLLRWIKDDASIEGENWADLVKIYSQWIDRYPNRAESYIETGLIWQCYLGNIDKSQSIVSSGIEKQAQPIEVLEFYQKFQTQDGNTICIK